MNTMAIMIGTHLLAFVAGCIYGCLRLSKIEREADRHIDELLRKWDEKNRKED